MPRIYVTYRPEDSARDDAEHLIERLTHAFGTDNIIRSAAGGNLDADYLAKLVNGCDALIVVIGRFWQRMLDDDGRQILYNADDYQFIELKTALAKPRDAMWVTAIFTDNAKVPPAAELPLDLRSLVERDILIVNTLDELDKALDLFVQRIGMADAEAPQADPEDELAQVREQRRDTIVIPGKPQTPDEYEAALRRYRGVSRSESMVVFILLVLLCLWGLLRFWVASPSVPPVAQPTSVYFSSDSVFTPVRIRDRDTTFTPVPVLATFRPTETLRPTRTPSPTPTLTRTPAS